MWNILSWVIGIADLSWSLLRKIQS